MADAPDFSELARRYVDLWQDHLTALAGDPALAESIARLFTGVVPWPVSPGAGGERAYPFAPGAAAAAAASRQRDHDMGELARRLAAAEERLAALEARIRGARARPAAKPRRRRV